MNHSDKVRQRSVKKNMKNIEYCFLVIVLLNVLILE